MPVEEELAQWASPQDMLLTIGVFDGVHLGHKQLISHLRQQAHQQSLASGVVTFHQHPQEVLSPQSRLPYLTDLDEKVELLKREGVDRVIILSFTRELAQLGARQFVSLLKKYLRMCGLVIGPDFVLGRSREGSAETLSKLGQEMNFTVTVVPPVVVNGEVASSTVIREALAEGDMQRVAGLIGRPFRLQGRVVSGVGRGSKLGFPTANLEIDSKQALPVEGVYATWTHIENRAYQSMTNIGRRPTFGGNERTVETYIIDYEGDLYGHQLKIDVVERLRGERRFKTEETLKKQIARDIRRGRTILDFRRRN